MPRHSNKYALFLICLIVLSNARGSAHSQAYQVAGDISGECGNSVPKTGEMFGALRLGNPVEFDDGIGITGGKCFPLYAGQKLLTWLSTYQRVGARVFVQRCVENRSVTDVAPEHKGGFVEDEYEEMLSTGEEGAATFTRLDIPLWSEFSRPAFCNFHIAYWGIEPDSGGHFKVYAVVFDLNAGEVVRKELAGVTQIESDGRDFFPEPIWEADGQSVRFDNATPAEGTSKLRDGRRSIKLTI